MSQERVPKPGLHQLRRSRLSEGVAHAIGVREHIAFTEMPAQDATRLCNFELHPKITCLGEIDMADGMTANGCAGALHFRQLGPRAGYPLSLAFVSTKHRQDGFQLGTLAVRIDKDAVDRRRSFVGASTAFELSPPRLDRPDGPPIPLDDVDNSREQIIVVRAFETAPADTRKYRDWQF